jgi:hypothetical protein
VTPDQGDVLFKLFVVVLLALIFVALLKINDKLS